MDSSEFNPRVIGHIVAVQGFRVKVELLPEAKSPSRATLDGVQTAVAINAYLTFSIGAGQSVIGIITDLESRESFDPTSGDELTLELAKPRRVASVQLLGTVELDEGKGTFNAGISVLPTLDTAAEIGSPELLRAVFENPPKRNKPSDYSGADFDCELKLGHPIGQRNSVVRASYNDVFSRPIAIVGNTGSGKSFTVSSLVQKAMAALGANGNEPHIFIIDINGEYAPAFLENPDYERLPDRIYLNGKPFSIPLWLMNAEEICAWLRASEQTQEPVLKDWWAIAKAEQSGRTVATGGLQEALSALDSLVGDVVGLKRKAAGAYCDMVLGYLTSTDFDTTAFEAEFTSHRSVNQYNTEVVGNAAAIQSQAEALANLIRAKLSEEMSQGEELISTADTPVFIPIAKLRDPSLVNRAVSREDTLRVEAHLTTLKLRLKTRLEDRRWWPFLNYELEDTKFSKLRDWLVAFGLGATVGPKVVLLDLSMLSHEVLPFACSVIGRILVETRERVRAADRFRHPWVLVLEEAHNYARPARSDEQRGQALSRLAFERIAKEGRKFGLSLVIASQRPSEVSATIVSQCANFISHRLQNPDDIDHFRRIIPAQARRLLDQVTILASGEAIVFGSAFHIPTRVQIDAPSPTPYSQTAAPYVEWRKSDAFPLDEVMRAWGLAEETPPSPDGTSGAEDDFDFSDDFGEDREIDLYDEFEDSGGEGEDVDDERDNDGGNDEDER